MGAPALPEDCDRLPRIARGRPGGERPLLPIVTGATRADALDRLVARACQGDTASMSAVEKYVGADLANAVRRALAKRENVAGGTVLRSTRD